MELQDKYPTVKHLVCFAGPPCSGKTHAMRSLQRGGSADLASMLGIEDPESLLAFAPGWLPPNCPKELDRALFHYDFLRIWKFGGEGGRFEIDRCLRVLERCETVQFVTLTSPSSVLLDRFKERPIGQMMSKVLLKPGALYNLMSGYLRTRRLYSNPKALLSLYEEWLSFTSRFDPESHHIVDTSGSYDIVDVENLASFLTGTTSIEEPTGLVGA